MDYHIIDKALSLTLLQIPGGNITSQNACAQQFGVEQSVFGQEAKGVGSVEDCDKMPDALKEACKWRFDWFKDASFPRYANAPNTQSLL